MEKFVNLVVSGLVFGALYSLLASATTLLYSTTGIFNLSHGALAALCALVYYELNSGLDWPVWVSAAATICVFAPLMGLLLERLVFRDLSRTPEAVRIVGTVGLIIALPNIGNLIAELGRRQHNYGWGGRLFILVLALAFTFATRALHRRWKADASPNAPQQPPGLSFLTVVGAAVTWGLLVGDVAEEIFRANLQNTAATPGIGPVPSKIAFTIPATDIAVNSNQLIIWIAAAVSAVLLYLLVARTPLGLRMRAVVDRRDLAALRGVNPVQTSQLAWLSGAVLAGIIGVITGPVFGLTEFQYTGLLIVASTAVVFARFRSLPLAFGGGLLLGVIANLLDGYLPEIGFLSDIVGVSTSGRFFLLFFALYFLGRGRGRTAGSVVSEPPPADWLADLAVWRQALPWAIAGLGLLAWSFGWLQWGTFVADNSEHLIIMKGLALGLIFMSFTVVTGLGGMVSLAQSTFVVAGAVTAGLATNQGMDWIGLWPDGAPFIPAVLLGGLVSLVLGLVVAIPALRLGGVALALATLSMAYIADQILFKVESFANIRGNGWNLDRPKFWIFDFADDQSYIVLLLLVVLAFAWIIRNLQKSATGRAMLAVRTAQSAAASAGISPPVSKLRLFGLSAFIAGVGGSMLFTIDGSVRGTSVPVFQGLFWLTVTVTFGVRSPKGAILAGLVSQVFPRVLSQGLRIPGVDWLPFEGTDLPQIPLILFGLGAISLASSPDGVVSVAASENWRRRQRQGGAPASVADAGGAEVAAARPADGAGIPTEDAALVLREVHSGYGDIEVLHGVTLAVPRGSIVALLGSNGAGKSTLCQTAAGMLAVTAGAIEVLGHDVTKLSAHVRARSGDLVLAPESRGVFPGLSVDDNLNLYLDDDEKQIVFERYPVLQARRRLPAGNLSGGEQQMLTLAPLLARPPRVLVADEPTLGLAPLVVQELMGLFEALRDGGTALLLVEEKARDVVAIADHVAYIELGRITWGGPASTVDVDEMGARYLGAAGDLDQGGENPRH